MIAVEFIRSVRSGQPVGDALTAAKSAIGADDADLDEHGLKTILSFNLYGAPWHVFADAPARNSRPPVVSESVLDRYRKSRESAGTSRATGSDLLERIRRDSRESLSESDRRFLIGRDEARETFRRFRDSERIDRMLSEWQASLETCRFEALRKAGRTRYRISGGGRTVGDAGDPGIPHLFSIVVDHDGTLLKTLVSKGQP